MPRVLALAAVLLATAIGSAHAAPAPEPAPARASAAPAAGREQGPVPCDSAEVRAFIERAQAEGDHPSVGAGGRMDSQWEDHYCGPGAPPYIENVSAGRTVRISTRELCREMQRQRQALPAGESLFWRQLLASYTEALDAGARRLRWKVGPRLHIASVVAADPNARVVPFPGCDDRVILYNRRFALFAHWGRQELGVLLQGVTGQRGSVPLDRDGVLRAVRDPAVRARYATYARSIVDMPTGQSAPEMSAAAEAMHTGTQLFAVAHEYAHLARGHAGGLAGDAPTSVRDEDRIERWARELEADYDGVQLFLTASDVELDGSTRLLRWAPLILLTDLESLHYLQRLERRPGPPVPWPYPGPAKRALRDALGGLPRAPATDDFAAILAGLDPGAWADRGHPPEHVRAEVVRLALLRNGAITADEYAGFSPADAWSLGIRMLYNDAAPALAAARDR